MQTQGLETHFGIAPHDPLQSRNVSVTIESMTVGFHPAVPDHYRGSSTYATCGRCIDRTATARPDRGDFQTDTGLELRVGFSETNLIHSELSRTGDAPLLARAADLRQVLIEQGWIELIAPATQ